MRFLLSYGVAFLLIVGIGVWMASGTLVQGGQGAGNGERAILDVLELPEDSGIRGVLEQVGLVTPTEPTQENIDVATEEPEAEAEALQSVRTQAFVAQDLPLTVSLRGNTKASATVSIRAETTGILKTRHVNKGDHVKAGDLLCEIDEGTRKAQLAQAKASLAKAELDYSSNKTLREKGLSPANSGRQFEAALEAARAAVDGAQAELERTVIYSEVAGIVQDPIAQPGDMLSAGAACVTLVQMNPILFSGDIPEARINAAAIGLPVTVKTITGQEVVGTLSYVSPTSNTATRAFPVEVKIPNDDYAIRAGLTAEATAVLGTVKAHLVPQSVLTLDSEGTIGVRAVLDGTVVFHAIQIVRDTTKGIWVTGLPGNVEIITFGQEYVIAGQKVVADNISDEKTS
ncbi:efflux RND transporter periplasmic adaptor subunit [Maritalea porphyrae]|jgi:multidrug efflux system membrane fusion protein|uniref:efflux RND transporter periplasmic adaptor subunit n=1 Tax=Maritalea porphyrae TaxID=880732 RepID=UPI0022AF5A0A|nr:efflux RND transporter periplasmic adaptor subunit [Maritalea porphyrae]MCZ4271009.1 efflux RND transporter periplasmic adaptor subunit [Maritalea porphyrae]